jgi:hypothetical protein
MRCKMDTLGAIVVLVIFAVALYFLLLNSNRTADAELGVKGGEGASVAPRVPDEPSQEEVRDDSSSRPKSE